MEVHLTRDQQAFVRQAVASGRFLREEDAVKEALSLWEERERVRAEILIAADEAGASLAGGDGRAITQDSMRELADDVKRRGRARLAAAHLPRRESFLRSRSHARRSTGNVPSVPGFRPRFPRYLATSAANAAKS